MPRRPGSDRPSPDARPLVESVEELHVLLWVRARGGSYVAAAEAADGVALTVAAVARCLEQLARRNLLDVRLGEDIRYRYAPAGPELACAVDALADEWRHSPQTLVRRLVARRSARHFSEAFRLRGDDVNG